MQTFKARSRLVKAPATVSIEFKCLARLDDEHIAVECIFSTNGVRLIFRKFFTRPECNTRNSMPIPIQGNGPLKGCV